MFNIDQVKYDESIYIYIYIYTKKNMYWSNIKSKNIFFILTNISVVLHNLLQSV